MTSVTRKNANCDGGGGSTCGASMSASRSPMATMGWRWSERKISILDFKSAETDASARASVAEVEKDGVREECSHHPLAVFKRPAHAHDHAVHPRMKDPAPLSPRCV